MSKTLKVSDQVYLDLDDMRGKRETFSQVVERLVGISRSLFTLLCVLEGKVKFEEWKRAQLEAQDATH